MISGGHLVAKALKNEGVEVIWTLCGGHIIDIYDGCIDEGIKIIDVRHEQVAAHAADGYSRQSGKIGCVVTTAGPGTTNAMTGIANAFRAESPLLDDRRAGRASRSTRWGRCKTCRTWTSCRQSPSLPPPCRTPSASPIWSRWPFANRSTARRGRAIWKSRATCSTPRCRWSGRAFPKPGAYRASTKSVGDPADIEKLADILVKVEKARARCSARRYGPAAAMTLLWSSAARSISRAI